MFRRADFVAKLVLGGATAETPDAKTESVERMLMKRIAVRGSAVMGIIPHTTARFYGGK
jgi:hypothetical protein